MPYLNIRNPIKRTVASFQLPQACYFGIQLKKSPIRIFENRLYSMISLIPSLQQPHLPDVAIDQCNMLGKRLHDADADPGNVLHSCGYLDLLEEPRTPYRHANRH